MSPHARSFQALFQQLIQLLGTDGVDPFLDANPDLSDLLAVATCGDSNRQRKFLGANPVFMSMSVVREIVAEGSLLDTLQQAFAEFGVLIEDSQGIIRVTADDALYPLGGGPIEGIWSSVASGERSFDEALAEARNSKLASRLSAIYVGALSRANLALMRTSEVQRATWRQRIVMATVNAIDLECSLLNENDCWAIRKWSGAAWVEIAAVSFALVADLRIFADALAVADNLIAESERRNDRKFLGQILERKGVLYLDPYTVNRPSADYERHIQLWRAHGREAMGADAAAVEESVALPHPYDALQLAIAAFRRAISVGEGYNPGVLLAAYAQALMRAKLMFAPVQFDELRSVATEGISIARANGDEVRITQLSEILSAVEELSTVRRTRLGDLELHTYLADSECDSTRIREWITRLDAVADGVGDVDLTGEPFLFFRDLDREAFDESSAGTIVLLATICLRYEREVEGLEILGDPRQIEERYPDHLVEPIRWLYGLLALNAGSTRVTQGNPAEAIKFYMSALEVNVSLGLQVSVISCLERVRDLARIETAQDRLLGELLSYGLRIGRSMSTSQLWSLQLVLQAANATLFEAREVSAPRVFLLWQIAKGLGFATIARRGLSELTHLDGPDWQELTALLDEVSFEPEPLQSQLALDEYEAALLEYAGVEKDALEHGEAELSARAKYDRRLEATLLEAAERSETLPMAESPLLGIEDVRVSLGPESVLANFYFGQSSTGEMALFLMLVTAERTWVAQTRLSLPFMMVHSAGALTHPFAPLVANVRKSIQVEEEPGGESASAKLLRECYPLLFSGFGAVLDDLHDAGKRHLCIVPHGPLHYFPFHALLDGDTPLVSKWTISYLPNVVLLGLDGRRPQSAHPRGRNVTAFACRRWMGDHLIDLPETIDEATAIAAEFGGDPLLEESFDMDHVVATLTSGNRYVHFGTHGEMDVAAPCFHSLLMAPRDGQDRRLYAFQLQQLDLRGIDLLTLASCRTALGKFDLADNLRGLPAYFLACGVSAMIGTLWEVESEPALTFFTHLYRHLRKTGNRLEAFAHAQQKTRESFPRYRDWGAFCYLGEWSETIQRPEEKSISGIPYLRFTGSVVT